MSSPALSSLVATALGDAPDQLDAWWQQEAQRLTGAATPAEALEQLRPAVQALTEGFTTERPTRFPVYLASPLARVAYGLFFFPQSLVRTAWVVTEALRRGWQPPSSGPVQILDLGAGSAPAGLAAALALGAHLGPGGPGQLTLTAVDHAAAALASLPALAAALGDRAPQVRTVVQDLQRNLPDLPDGPADLLVASFALNEVAADTSEAGDGAALQRLRRWGRLVGPNGLLVLLEPALAETARRLARLRPSLVREGWHIYGPCLHAEACPLLAEPKAWCHEVRTFAPPAGAEFLNRTLHRRLPDLKFSFLVLGRSPPPPAPVGPETFRLVAPLAALKGRWLTRGCTADGRALTYDLPARDLTIADQERLDSFHRGDVLQAATVQPLGQPDTFRLPPPAMLEPWPGGEEI